MDFSATLLEIGGGTADPAFPLDGVSLRAVLRDPSTAFERPLFWRMKHRQQRAMRLGPWKYLKVDDDEFLFNVDVDARERANLAHRHPERFRHMREAWLAWNATMPVIPDDAQVSLPYSASDMPQR
ncbi:MAG: hypothetical protein EOO78_35400 [Oxalobacteraceae bacterium]|nr:MAG: hypothetical protein EOO78_35400 [Oxalobacteraceae bacterium]